MRQVAGWAKARQGGRWQTVGRVPPGKMAGGRGGVGVRGGVGGPLGHGVGTQLTDGWYSIRRFSLKGDGKPSALQNPPATLLVDDDRSVEEASVEKDDAVVEVGELSSDVGVKVVGSSE